MDGETYVGRMIGLPLLFRARLPLLFRCHRLYHPSPAFFIFIFKFNLFKKISNAREIKKEIKKYRISSQTLFRQQKTRKSKEREKKKRKKKKEKKKPAFSPSYHVISEPLILRRGLQLNRQQPPHNLHTPRFPCVHRCRCRCQRSRTCVGLACWLISNPPW